MDVEALYADVVERISLEYGFLFLMLISSAYMIWESYNFDIDPAATFPRLTAGTVLIGTLLLVFRSYLPAPLYTFVAESADLVDVDEENLEGGQGDEGPTPAGGTDELRDEGGAAGDSISTVGRPVHDTLFTALSALGYGILGYAIGILWASPIFVLIYGLWFKLSWRALLILIPLSLLIGYGFMEALGVRIDRGAYFMTEGL